uniref:Sec-independent protein translocase component TatC n=1 Tax=Periphykon beckeri TaxID=2006982 RepID=UPI0022FD9C6C|nr:Sec-independent protein translocase component TatC [Periphykon beckeri]WAX04153.1 Sec-independent protein translocase component TatC [Periphykon beckeri]
MYFLIYELTTILKYFVFSFCFFIFITFKKFSILLLFFFYPIGKLFKKKLLILQVLELINITFFLNFSMSSFFVFFFFIFLLQIFFSAGWFDFQIYLFKLFCLKLIKLLSFLFFLYYVFYIFLFNFGLVWNFYLVDSFQLFEIQFQIVNFFKFQIYNFNFFVFFFFIFLISLILVVWLYSWKKIFFIATKLNILSFFFFLSLFFFDLTLEFFYFFLFLLFFFEFFFLYLFWKLF